MHAQGYRSSEGDAATARALLLIALLLAPAVLVALPSTPPAASDAAPRFAPPDAPLGVEAPHRPPAASAPAPRATGDVPYARAAPAAEPPGTFAVLDASAGILDLAASTSNVSGAYDWVGRNVAWTPSWGLRKSPTTTFHTREGNAFDQAQLLADLVRLQGTPAVVTVGTIRVPLADLRAWAGVEDTATLLRALEENGVPASRDVDRVTMEHAWVQVKLDGGWIALDPSFKLKRPVGALNVTLGAAELGLDHWNRNLTVSEVGYLPAYAGPLMMWGVLEHARKTHPEWTVGQALGIARWDFTRTPAQPPPYEVLGVHAQTATFPEDAVASVTIAGPGFERTWPTWWLSDRRVTFVGEPATHADREAMLARIGGKPVAIVNVVPVLKIDGEAVATGPKLTEWQHMRVNVTFDEDRGADVARSTLQAGGHYAFAFHTGRASSSDMLRRAEETAYLAGVFWQEQSTVAREAVLARLFDVAARSSFHELTPLQLTAWMERVLVVPAPSAVVVGIDWSLDGASLESAASGETIQLVILRDVVGAYHRFGERGMELAFRHAWGDRFENAVLRLFPLGSVATPAIVLLASHTPELRPLPPRPPVSVVVGGSRRAPSIPADYTDPRARAFQSAGFTVRQTDPWHDRGLVAYFAVSADGLSWGAIVAPTPGGYAVGRAPSIIAFGLCDICSSAFDIGSSVSEFGSSVPSPSKAKGGDCKKYGPPQPPRDLFGREFGKEIVKDVAGDILDNGFDAAKDEIGLEGADWEGAIESGLEGDGGEGLGEAARGEVMDRAWGEATGGAKSAALGGDGNTPKGHGEATFDAASGVTDAITGALGSVPWAMPYTVAKGFVRETTRVWDSVNDQLGRLASHLDGDCDDDEEDEDEKKRRRKGPGKDHPDDNLIVGQADVLYTGLLASYAREAEIAQAPEFRFLVAARDELVRYDSPLNATYAATTRAEVAAVDALLRADVRVNEIPRVLLLENGYWPQMRALLGNEGLAVRLLEPSEPFETFAGEHPVLVIPSGGLGGLEAPVFRARLEAYAKAGGRIVSFAQAYGDEFEALPGAPRAYGWNEDISCRFGGSYAPSSHPALAGLDLAAPGVNIDGFFLSLPAGATTLLARSATGQPAAALWKVGNGTVVASALFPDYAAGIGLASAQDLALPRSMVLWALHPDANQSLAGAVVDLPVKVENRGDRASAFVNITLVGPGGRAAHLGRAPAVIAPGANRTLVVQWTAPEGLPGLWTVDALLTDAAGAGIVRDLEVGAVAVHAGQRTGARARPVDVAVTGAQQITYGSRLDFTVHLWEREGVDRDVTVRVNLPRTSGATEFDWFAPRRVFLPAHGHVQLNYTQDPVLRSDRVDVTVAFPGGEADGRLTFFTETDTVGSMRLDAEEKHVRPNGKVPIWANLTAEPTGIVNLTVVVRAPGGAETRFYRSVRADARGLVREQFEYSLGATPSSETYVVRGNASTPKRSLAIAYEQFNGPRPAITVDVRRPGEIQVGGAPAEIVFTLRNGGTAAANGVLNVTGTSWEVLPGFSRSVTIPAGGSLDVPYRFNVTRVASVSLSWLYTQERLSQRGYFYISTNLTLDLELDQPRYSPGAKATVTARLENRGPFSFPVTLRVTPSLDSTTTMTRTGLASAPGQDTVATFNVTVPESAPDGAFDVYGDAARGSQTVAWGYATLYTLPFTVASATTKDVAPGGTYAITLENLVAEPATLTARSILLSLDGREVANVTTTVTLPPLGTAPLAIALPAHLATGPHALQVSLRRGATEVLRYADVLNVTGATGGFTFGTARHVVAAGQASSVPVAYGAPAPAGSSLEVKVFAGRSPSWLQTPRKIDLVLVEAGDYVTSSSFYAAGWVAGLAEAGHDVNLTVVTLAASSESGYPGRRTTRATLGYDNGAEVALSQYQNPEGAWAPAVTRLASTHPWRTGAEKVVVVAASELSYDTPSFSATPVVISDNERRLATETKNAAAAAGVRLVPYALDFALGEPVWTALAVATPEARLSGLENLLARLAPGAVARGDTPPVLVHSATLSASATTIDLPALAGPAPYRLEAALRLPGGDLLSAQNLSIAVTKDGRQVSLEPRPRSTYDWRLNLTDPAWAAGKHRVTILQGGYVYDDDLVTFDATGFASITVPLSPHDHLVVLVDDAYVASGSAPPAWFRLPDAFDGLSLSPESVEGPPPIRLEFYGYASDTPVIVPARLLSPFAGEWMILVPTGGTPSPTSPVAFEGGRHTLRWLVLGQARTSLATVVVPNPVTVTATASVLSTTAARAVVELKNAGTGSVTGPLTVTVPGIGTYARTVTVAAGATRSETFDMAAPPIAGSYGVRARFEPSSVPPAEGLGVLAAPPQLTVLERPSNVVLAPGENRTIALKVRNDGFLPAYATLALDAGSLARDSATTLLAAGETATLALEVFAAPDAPRGNFSGRIDENGLGRPITVRVLGPAASLVSSSLDREEYRAGDTATLRVVVRNTGELGANLTVRASYQGVAAERRAFVAPGALLSANLSVPVGAPGLRLGYSVRGEAGGNLLVDALRVHAPAASFSLRPDRERVPAGGTFEVRVRTPAPMQVVLSDAWGGSGVVDTQAVAGTDYAAATWLTRAPATALAGAYVLRAEASGARTTGTIDVSGSDTYLKRTSLGASRLEVVVASTAAGAGVLRLHGGTAGEWNVTWAEGDTTIVREARGIAGAGYRVALWSRDAGGNLSLVEARVGLTSTQGAVVEPAASESEAAPTTDTERRVFEVSVFMPAPAQARLLVGGRVVALANASAGLQTLTFRAGPFPVGAHEAVVQVGDVVATLPFVVVSAPATYLLNGTATPQPDGRWVFEVEAAGVEPAEAFVSIAGVKHPLAKVASRGSVTIWRSEPIVAVAPFQYSFGASGAVRGDTGLHTATVAAPGGGAAGPLGIPAWAWVAGGGVALAAVGAGAWFLLRRR